MTTLYPYNNQCMKSYRYSIYRIIRWASAFVFQTTRSSNGFMVHYFMRILLSAPSYFHAENMEEEEQEEFCKISGVYYHWQRQRKRAKCAWRKWNGFLPPGNISHGRDGVAACPIIMFSSYCVFTHILLPSKLYINTQGMALDVIRWGEWKVLYISCLNILQTLSTQAA